jgi:hypothetical protein
MHYENVSQKEAISADEGATNWALLKKKNVENRFRHDFELRLSTVSSYILSDTILNTIVFLYF